MEIEKKKPYAKPGIVFENCVTGELTGSPEMIERIMREAQWEERNASVDICPFEDTPCVMRGSAK